MSWLLVLIIGIVGGILIGGGLGEKELDRSGLIERQALEKAKSKKRILAYFRRQGKINNNQVEKLLKVSDATATRYLEELEKEGWLKQVGRTGRSVFYKKAR